LWDIGEIEGQPGIPARRSLLQLDALFSPVVLEHDVDRLDDDARPAPFSAGLLDDGTTAIHRSSGSYRTRDRPRHQPYAGSYDATGRITNVLAVDHGTGLFTACDHEPGDQQR
jgi:hypothetical protein